MVIFGLGCDEPQVPSTEFDGLSHPGMGIAALLFLADQGGARDARRRLTDAANMVVTGAQGGRDCVPVR